jgi:hypothetical protein
MTFPRTPALPALALALLALAPPSRAAPEGDVCLTAPVDGQRARKAGELLEARERFTTCASRTCPARIVQECTRWLHEVDDALPSVVAIAKDGGGADLVDVKIQIDERPVEDISARAIPLDPGRHKIVFHRIGNADIAEDVLLHEGEKNRNIVATFKPAPALLVASTPVLISTRPVPWLVWVMGGVAVAGAASFATFGALGVSQRSSDGCAAGCTQADKDSIETKFHIGDISLAIGVVALVTGTVVYFTRPTKVHPMESAGQPLFDVHPVPGGGSMSLGARF